MQREEMNKLLGMTEAEMDSVAEEYESDAWDSGNFGKSLVGRPPLYEVAMGTVSFKEEKPKIELIDARALSLGMTRSDYLRQLVDKDLAATA